MTPCPSCNKPLAINHGRQVKTNNPMARAFCRSCPLDTGWVPGRAPEAAAAARDLAEEAADTGSATVSQEA